jgi:hypothetical protein
MHLHSAIYGCIYETRLLANSIAGWLARSLSRIPKKSHRENMITKGKKRKKKKKPNHPFIARFKTPV